jgi:hypothetical protein
MGQSAVTMLRLIHHCKPKKATIGAIVTRAIKIKNELISQPKPIALNVQNTRITVSQKRMLDQRSPPPAPLGELPNV